MDVVDRETRSRVMAAVRSTGNRSTELALIKVLRAYGVTGWRRKSPLLGKPDFVWPRPKVALFIDGCFWHGCSRHCRLPATNKSYWVKKVARNKQRDRLVRRELQKQGWKIMRVWEHEVKLPKNLIRKLRLMLEKSNRRADRLLVDGLLPLIMAALLSKLS
jgi:DNA mismatch endonuclease, patch repair protein